MNIRFSILPALFLNALLGSATLSFAQQTTAPEIYPVDTTASSVAWKAYKVTGKHNGTVDIRSGHLEMTGGELTGGAFEVNMQAIKVLDLKEGRAGKLEGHLKSDDFFGVLTFPTAQLLITKVISRGTPGNYKIIGDLTIKSITKPIKFDADVTIQDGQIMATGALQIDRSEYDVRYGSGSFFDNLGDRTIYDDFDLEVKLVAKKR